jgi:hypothetical protein
MNYLKRNWLWSKTSFETTPLHSDIAPVVPMTTSAVAARFILIFLSYPVLSKGSLINERGSVYKVGHGKGPPESCVGGVGLFLPYLLARNQCGCLPLNCFPTEHILYEELASLTKVRSEPPSTAYLERNNTPYSYFAPTDHSRRRGSPSLPRPVAIGRTRRGQRNGLPSCVSLSVAYTDRR